MRDALDDSKSVYLLSFPNLRSTAFQRVRADFHPDSRIFLGKLKLLQLALGRTAEDEYAENLHHFAKFLTGNVGLLLTSRPPAEVEQYFADFRAEDFARAGATAPRPMSVSNAQLEQFPASAMEALRKLGMPVAMQEGRVVLTATTTEDSTGEWRLCRAGEVLSAEKCKLLAQLDVKLVEFRVQLLCRWRQGEFEELDSPMD